VIHIWHVAVTITEIFVLPPPLAGRPRAHHRTIVSLFPVVCRQTGKGMFSVDDKK